MTTATEERTERKPEPAAFAGLAERFERLPLAQIAPSKTNPRQHFDESYLAQLQESILDKGVLEPLLVRPIPKGRFEIVAGECRYRASTAAGLTHVPAVIREYSDEQVLEIQLEENIHRKNLTPLEEARGYRRLITMNPDKHSAASIATRVGMSVSYVWDYLKLLDLIPEAQRILERELMTVGHAILIARLKPEDQRRVIAIDNGRNGYGAHREGLWQFQGGNLLDDDDPAAKKDPYLDVKAVSVRELDAWIRDHVRFDVEHMAKAQPLVYEETAAKVEEAAAVPGRGKKVIHITDEYRVADDARDPIERTYGSQSWERADGKEKSKPCDHSVLGVFVAGDRYGQTLQVCVARDKCITHWKVSVAAKEKAAKLRETGNGKKATTVEKKAEQKQESTWEREERARKVRATAWDAIGNAILDDAVLQVKTAKQLTAAQAKYFERDEYWEPNFGTAKKVLGASWFKRLPAALLVMVVGDWTYSSYSAKKSGYDTFIVQVAKPLGLNVKRLEAIRDKHQPAAPAKGKKAAAA